MHRLTKKKLFQNSNPKVVKRIKIMKISPAFVALLMSST